MEKFEITDYDLDNEFNQNRKRRKFTKNDAIYGIWNDEDVCILKSLDKLLTLPCRVNYSTF